MTTAISIFKTIVAVLLLVLVCIPMTYSIVYLFSGFNQTTYLAIISEIPAKRMWMFIIPTAIATCFFWYNLILFLLKKKQPRQPEVLSIDDPDINKKLQRIYFR